MIKIILPFLLVFLLSCTDNSQKSINLIPENEMVSILVEIHLLEAQFEKKNFSVDSLAVFAKANYDHIFSRHSFSREMFFKSFSFYESNPKKMDALYLKVVDELSKMEADLSGAANDSLKTL